ncbi:MAG: DNA-directed RNA polymerase subunit K [Conexivisphaera sp.]|jgi:DNA-directed RNA polymerase I, II, and III subunit RPABC2
MGPEVDNLSSGDQEIEIRIGPPRLTRFERARILGARALQLSLGAPPLIPATATRAGSTIEVAKAELESGALPISIRRSLPNGVYQDIPLRALLHVSSPNA